MRKCQPPPGPITSPADAATPLSSLPHAHTLAHPTYLPPPHSIPHTMPSTTSTTTLTRRARVTKRIPRTWDEKFPKGTASKAGKRRGGRPLSVIAEASPSLSPMSSTETLVDFAADVSADAKKVQVAARIELIAAEVTRPKVRRQATLVPLHVALARADIRLRPEGSEGVESPRLPKRRASAETVWWKSF